MGGGVGRISGFMGRWVSGQVNEWMEMMGGWVGLDGRMMNKWAGGWDVNDG